MSLNDQQNDNSDNLVPSESQAENNVSGPEKWLDDNKKPDYIYLESLANQGTPESLEELRAIADDHDVIYDTDSSVQELVDKINSAIKKEDGGESI